MIRRIFASSKLIFIASATALVNWSPPTGITRAHRICAPRATIARDDVEPMSTKQFVTSVSALRR